MYIILRASIIHVIASCQLVRGDAQKCLATLEAGSSSMIRDARDEVFSPGSVHTNQSRA